MNGERHGGPWRPRRPAHRDEAGGSTSIGGAVEAFLRSQGHEEAGELGALLSCWDEVAGAEVAAHATPRSLRDGVLVVAVDHPAWATQLAFLSGHLLASLERRLGRPVATSLEVTTRRRRGVE